MDEESYEYQENLENDNVDEETEYQQQKDVFLDKVFAFIKNSADFDITACILVCQEFIIQYQEYYNDNAFDVEMIAQLQQSKEQFEKTLEQSKILEVKTTPTEQKQVTKEAQGLQFKYGNSRWRKLFNQRSVYNELYGQALFHVTLGVVTDLKIEAKDKELWARPNLFYIQRSRSGKNQGMYFVEEAIEPLIKNNRKIVIRQGGKQTDPTLLDRPEIELNKSGGGKIKKYENGEPIVLPGILSKTDLFWYPEANFLLNPTSKDNMEAVNIHLHLLESNGKYEKELTGWQGFSTTTYGGHYSLVALTRPIHNIKQHILFSGLLPRCLFIPRLLTKEDRQKMRQLTVLYMHRTQKAKEEYKKEFDLMVQEFKSIQEFVVATKIRIRDEDSEKIIGSVNEKLEALSKHIEDQFLTEQNIEVIEDFIGNYTDHLTILAFQTAAVRKSEFVELVDYEYAFNFLKLCLDEFIPWLEETVEPERRDIERNMKRQGFIRRYAETNKGNTMKVSSAINELKALLKCSYPTARRTLFDFAGAPHNLYVIDVDAKIINF